MKLGITSYAYRWAVGGDRRFGETISVSNPMKPVDLVRKTAELGLEVVQICENVDLNMPEKDLRNLRKTAEDLNVDLELGTAGLSTSVLKKCLNISMLTNARLVRVYPNEKESIIEIVERLRSFSPILRSKGITLAIENSSLCLYTSRQLAEIIRKAKSPHIGACVDVVNSIGLLEKPIETVKILSQYAVSLHVKDYRIKRNNAGGFTIYGVPLGKGMLDLRGILKIFKHKGQEPNILLEQFMSQKENIAKTLREEERWIKEGIKHLKLSIKKE